LLEGRVLSFFPSFSFFPPPLCVSISRPPLLPPFSSLLFSSLLFSSLLFSSLLSLLFSSLSRQNLAETGTGDLLAFQKTITSLHLGLGVV
jgi:hypothetical protein